MTTRPQDQHADGRAAPTGPGADPKRWRALDVLLLVQCSGWRSPSLPPRDALRAPRSARKPMRGRAVGVAVLVTLALRAAEDAVRTGTDPGVAIIDGDVPALRVGAGVLVVAVGLAAALLRPGVGRGTAPATLAH